MKALWDPPALRVRRDPRLEPVAFRWPDERPRPRPMVGVPAGMPAAPAWETWGQRALLTAGVALSLWIFLAPQADGLSVQGQRGFAIFALCTTLWVTNALPFGATGLLAVALLGLTGAMPPGAAFAAFGSPAVFFLLGVFILAAALVESGLSKRCALLFLRRFERSPSAFATGLLLAAAFGTLWMPNQATSAMLFPIALEVAIALRLAPRQSAYAKVLFLSLAWGAMIGSNASFLGSTRAALALGMLQQKYGLSIAFAEWVVAALPIVVLGLLVAPVMLRLVIRAEPVDFASARTVLERSVAEMGRMQRRQWVVAAILVATVAAWIAFSAKVDLAIISLLGAATVFATGSLKWEEAERRVYWNIVLMYGGAIALGVVIDQTGAARWLVERVIGTTSISPFVAVSAAVVGTLLLSEFMSNAAAVAVMLPLAFSLGDQLGAPPVALVLATSIGAGLDFALPFSSAPNTIAFASGYLRMVDVVKAGALMTVVSIAIVLIVAHLWWPFLGVL
jgi:sodium-dependent dicarboxylate transporter 2/3/5